MKPLNQNDLDRIRDRVHKGELTTAQANVEMVRVEGVRELNGPVPRDVRAALNAAVRAGRLGHMRRDGQRPEVYYHPNGEDDAHELRCRRHNEAMDALKRVCAAGAVTAASSVVFQTDPPNPSDQAR